LGVFGEDILRKLTDPLLEERCDNAGIVQFRLVQKVDVKFCARVSANSI